MKTARYIEYGDKKCGECGKPLNDIRYPHIHHIDGNHNNNDPDNRLLVCPQCHSHLHGYPGIDRGEVTQLRQQGLSLQAIGKIYGVSRQRIHQILKSISTTFYLL